MTTVVLGRNGKYYDLGRGEFPGTVWTVSDGKLKRKKYSTLPQDAFACTQERADELTGRVKQEGTTWPAQ